MSLAKRGKALSGDPYNACLEAPTIHIFRHPAKAITDELCPLL